MIPISALHIALALEAAAPMKLTGIAVKGIRKTAEGKIVKKDTAPPHVRQARRRKAGKVTGAKGAR